MRGLLVVAVVCLVTCGVAMADTQAKTYDNGTQTLVVEATAIVQSPGVTACERGVCPMPTMKSTSHTNLKTCSTTVGRRKARRFLFRRRCSHGGRCRGG